MRWFAAVATVAVCVSCIRIFDVQGSFVSLPTPPLTHKRSKSKIITAVVAATIAASRRLTRHDNGVLCDDSHDGDDGDDDDGDDDDGDDVTLM